MQRNIRFINHLCIERSINKARVMKKSSVSTLKHFIYHNKKEKEIKERETEKIEGEKETMKRCDESQHINIIGLYTTGEVL